jgi:hypothetical protein
VHCGSGCITGANLRATAAGYAWKAAEPAWTRTTSICMADIWMPMTTAITSLDLRKLP